MIFEIEYIKTWRAEIKPGIRKIKTDIIKMKSNQVRAIPDMLNIETEYCKSKLKYEAWKLKPYK